jgi:hypothetical protein
VGFSSILRALDAGGKVEAVREADRGIEEG